MQVREVFSAGSDDLTAIGKKFPAKQPQERRFSGTVWPQKADSLAGIDLKTQTLEKFCAGIAEMHVGELRKHRAML